MDTQIPCCILVGPEDQTRRKAIAKTLAPRLDYRLVAERLNATIVECAPSPAALQGRKVTRVMRSLARNSQSALQMVWHVSDGSVIYSAGETWGLPASLAIKLLGRSCTHVVYVHRVFSPAWLRFLRVTRRLLAVDGWICVTNHQAGLLRRALGPSSAPVTVVSQGVDTDFFDPAKANPPAGKPYLLAVGAEMRNYDLFFAAVCDLDVKVVVKASSAWMANGRSQLASIPANVKLITQRLTYVELRDLYAGAVLVVTPLYETAQAAGITTILEAMAMEIPVIATRSKGLPDILVHQRTGVIAEHSVEALADTIAELLDAQQRRVTLVDAAKRAVVAQVTVEEHARQVADFLILTRQKREKK